MPITHDYELFTYKRSIGTLGGSAPTKFTLKLYGSASVAPNVDSVVGDFTELANGNGYTTGGKDLTLSSFVITAGSGDDNARMDYASQVWTFTAAAVAIGGYYVIVNCDLKGTGAADYVMWSSAGAFTTTGNGDTYTVVPSVISTIT